MMHRNAFVLVALVSVALAACGGDTSGGAAVCGNGDLEAGELCDGADLGGADCASLGLEGGTLSCQGDCTFDASLCTGTASCGDGVRQYPEACDDTDLAGAACADFGFDGGELTCTASCQLDLNGCTGDPPCGDDLVAPGEQCDGVNLAGQTCESLGMGGGTLTCDGECHFDMSQCDGGPTCGNDVAEVTEACDGEDLNGATCVDAGFLGGTLSCANDCTFDVSMCYSGGCGDGVLDMSEECDSFDLGGATCVSEGFTGGTLACSNNCLFDTTACTNEMCGNDAIEGTEACDGTDFGGVTCQSLGHDGGFLLCTSTCTVDDSQCQDCAATDTDPPVASNHVPAPETLGYPEDGTIAVDLSDACGIDTATITMTLEVEPPMGPAVLMNVTPVITGGGTLVNVAWTPTTPLPAGAIVTVTVVVDDINGNTLTEVWRFSVVDTMLLVTASSGGAPSMNQLDETNPDTNISGFAEGFFTGGAPPDEQRVIIRFVNTLPPGAMLMDATLMLARCPGTFAPTTVSCYGMRVDSAAISSTWNMSVVGPPGPSAAWHTPGADGVPMDRAGTVGGSVQFSNASVDYVWETGPAFTLVSEWGFGEGEEMWGMICMNGNTTPMAVCSPFSNAPPQIEVVYGPPLP